MGSTVYSNTTKVEVVQRILQIDLRWQDGTKLIKHSIRGNCLWYIAQRPDGGQWIGLAVIRCHGQGEVEVKHMDESFGPCFYNCPISWLNETKSLQAGYSAQWRQEVRDRAAAAAAQRDRLKCLAPGAIIQYGAERYELVFKLPSRCWHVRDEAGGQFRMSTRQLKQAQVL